MFYFGNRVQKWSNNYKVQKGTYADNYIIMHTKGAKTVLKGTKGTIWGKLTAKRIKIRITLRGIYDFIR